MANNKGYKRSWKNYLLDPSYQLRFTFTMLAVAAGLMAVLGWYMSKKATTATEVAMNQIDEIRCPEVLSATPPAPTPPATTAPSDAVQIEDLLDESAPEPPKEEEPVPGGDEAGADEPESAPEGDTAGTESDTPDGEEGADGAVADGEDRERRRPEIVVNIDDSEMPEAPEVVVVGEIQERPPTPEEIAASQKAYDACQAKIAGKKSDVEGRKSLITLVMIISGSVLLLGLAFYGIKTTHRVAGPLFKVGLYLKKLENNVYDTVYNLRKGDQLVEFYEQFKEAHAGATTMQEQDRDRLKDAIKLAKEAGLADKSKEMADTIEELERLLAEKEESLAQKQA